MSADFLDHLRDLLAAFGTVRTRAMFGGHGVYCDGLLIGFAIDDALYLKVDAQTRGSFEVAGCAPYVYMGQRKPLTISYWSVPDEAMDSPAAIQPWARMAWEAASRKPGKRGVRKSVR